MPKETKNVIPEGVDQSYGDINSVDSNYKPENAIYDHTILSGEGWMHKIKAGQTFRIVDVEGNEAADCLFFNANNKEDFYSMQESIRASNNVYLQAGSKLMSSDGNLLLTITADQCGRHDTLGGCCSQESNQCRYAIEKKHMHACRQTFMLQMLDWGQGYSKKNIAHNINFFMNVPLTQDGKLYFDDGVSSPGRYVEMKAYIDVICLISNCPQLNNPCCGYNPTPLQVLIWDDSYNNQCRE